MKNPTVKSLRQQGYKVRVLHHRDYDYIHPLEKFDRTKKLMQKGGKTEVHVLSPDGKTAEGVALCSPKDNYDKKLGVKIALNRAINNLNQSKKVMKKGVDIDSVLEELLDDEFIPAKAIRIGLNQLEKNITKNFGPKISAKFYELKNLFEKELNI